MVYFNNAASSWPKAPGVVDTVSEWLSRPPIHPGRSFGQEDDVLAKCREAISKLINAESPNCIVLTTCATHSLNIAIWGLGLNQGSKVITTVTEHNSVLRPLFHLREKRNVEIVHIPLDGTGSLYFEEFERHIDESVKLVAINHASNVTGRVNDVRSFFSVAKQFRAVTLLDASQSMGLVDLDVKELHADIVAFTGHKALHGPPGTGGLYVSPKVELEQIFVGGTGVRSDLMLHPQDMPMRLEAGTPNVPAFAGLLAAINWHERDGIAHRQTALKLTDKLVAGLKQIPKVRIFGRQVEAEHIPIVSFKISGIEIEEVGYLLDRSFGIVCRTGLHCAPMIHKAIGSSPEGTIRFSLSGFNTEEEVDYAINAIRKLAR